MAERPPDGSPITDVRAPELSVIVPCWNAEDSIERALGTVLADRATPLEVIVVDDASTDGTLAILERLAAADPRVIVVRSPRNAGASAARNLALQRFRGTWLTFLDADDILTDGAIAALMAPTRTTDALDLGDDHGQGALVADGTGDLGDEDPLPEVGSLETGQGVFPAGRIRDRGRAHVARILHCSASLACESGHLKCRGWCVDAPPAGRTGPGQSEVPVALESVLGAVTSARPRASFRSRLAR